MHHWAAIGAGLGGWLLVASGAGKLTAWPDFRSGFADGRVLPRPLAAALSWIVPPVEAVCGLWVLARPGFRPLALAGILFGLFAAYQGELLKGDGAADCRCYGKIRRVPTVPGVVLANALLSALLIVLAYAGREDPLAPRLVWGLVAAAVFLGVAGLAGPKPALRGFPYAEVRYTQHRLEGKSDLAAREAVAAEFRLELSSTYLMVSRFKGLMLVLRARADRLMATWRSAR